MQMVQIWDMVQKVLAFYCWRDETELSSIWGVQSVHSQNTASVTPLVSHLFGMENVSFDKDMAPVCTELLRCLVLMVHLKAKKMLSQGQLHDCDHPWLLLNDCDK